MSSRRGETASSSPPPVAVVREEERGDPPEIERKGTTSNTVSVVAVGEEDGVDALDDIFGAGTRARLREMEDDPKYKARRAMIDRYKDYETYKIPVLTPRQLKDLERLPKEERSLALDKLGAAAREMKYDGKSVEEIAAHLRALGGYVEPSEVIIRWGIGEKREREMYMMEGFR